MIVTGHQVNLLPGVSVIEKIRAADAVIWMDTMQYERHGFVNRNRLSDGAWMTIPVNEHDTFAPINRVRIADPTFRARKKIAQKLRCELGAAAEPYALELLRPYPLLVGLNAALLRWLLADLGIDVEQHYQSHIDLGHALPVVSESDSELDPARERLAMMVAAIGGTVWLSGPSGSRYLNEEPFHTRGIEVRYFEWPEGTPNPSAIEALRERVAA
jgi:hypothetical protein